MMRLTLTSCTSVKFCWCTSWDEPESCLVSLLAEEGAIVQGLVVFLCLFLHFFEPDFEQLPLALYWHFGAWNSLQQCLQIKEGKYLKGQEVSP